MRIEILELLTGAEQARGLAVIIDVLRACSTACFVAAGGAERIIPLADLEEAYALKRKHPAYILMGEREGRIQPGFDFGNSPAAVKDVDFSGAVVVQTTSAGTRGLEKAAAGAGEIITGSFVNARAVIDYIRRRDPPRVSLVCMGNSGLSSAAEDVCCAEYIRNGLEGRPSDFAAMVARIRAESGRRFFDPALAEIYPQEDFRLCMELDRFAFVLRAGSDGGGLCLRRWPQPRRPG
jgi:2-phosphosulfolactate phosphatase